MDTPILQVSGLTKRFGGLTATDSLTFSLENGETHALIGPNGAGKTTLIAQLQGDLQPDSGTIRFLGCDITRERTDRRARRGMARSFQITSVFPKFTALTNVAMAVQASQGHSYRFWRSAVHDPALVEPALSALTTIGLAPRADVLASMMSHGERRQLELAMALAMKPKMLLLDEPMAGIGRQDAVRLTGILKELKSQYTILLVEHDMDVVFSLADRVSVLVAGRVIATGTPSEIRASQEVRLSYLGHKGQ